MLIAAPEAVTPIAIDSFSPPSAAGCKYYTADIEIFPLWFSAANLGGLGSVSGVGFTFRFLGKGPDCGCLITDVGNIRSGDRAVNLLLFFRYFWLCFVK